MKDLKLVLFFIVAVFLTGCKKDNDVTTTLNNALLFPEANIFLVDQIQDVEDIQFKIEASEPAFALIAIFSEAPEINSGEIANAESIIWQWQGSSFSGKEVQLTDGDYENGQVPLNIEYFQCNSNTLYWAAWAWDATGQEVTHSTEKDLELDIAADYPNVELISVRKMGATPNDTLLVPGSPITLQLTFRNTGKALASGLGIAVSHPSINDFAQESVLSDLDVNKQTSSNITFTIPPDFSFGDTISLQIKTTYNNCLESLKTTNLVINALSVCMLDVKLIHIQYLPPAIFWDPAALPIFYDPDIYYEVLGPEEIQLHQSIVIEDASDDWPNTPVMGDWPEISPCMNLKIDSTYTINFWDEDNIFDPDDFIGTVSFKPLNYLGSRDSMIHITNDEVIMELYLQWE